MFITSSVELPLKEIIGLLKAIVEIGMICSQLRFMGFYRSMGRCRRPEILSKSYSSYLWLAAVAGPIFALRQKRGRDN